MQYSNENTIKRIEAGEQLKYLLFWGHQKAPQISKSCFSQWYDAPFEIEGVAYPTAEHYMMAEKARLFGDQDIRQKIIASKKPGEAKALGRKVKAFDQQVWDSHRFDIVVKGNFHKFNQHPELKDFLRNANERILVEASPVDAIWGIGLSQEHIDAKNPALWRGLNLLGYALMDVRDIFQQP